MLIRDRIEQNQGEQLWEFSAKFQKSNKIYLEKNNCDIYFWSHLNEKIMKKLKEKWFGLKVEQKKNHTKSQRKKIEKQKRTKKMPKDNEKEDKIWE